jgi:primosomal protein N' (replication factor Y) (superfamily II helicase)
MSAAGEGIGRCHVEVALPLPRFQTFTYALEAAAPPQPGTRVQVPFRNREQIGWVVGPSDPSQIQEIRGIRGVLDVLESEPSFPPDLWSLALWMAEYYATPLGLVLRSLLPTALTDPGRDHLVRTDVPMAEALRVPPVARRVLDAVVAAGGRGTVRGLRSALGRGSPWPGIRWLTEQGLLHHAVEPPARPTIQTRRWVVVQDPPPDLLARDGLFGRAPRQRACLEFLEAMGGARELSVLTGEDGYSRAVIQGLESRGIVVLEDREAIRDPFSGRAEVDPPASVTLLPAQQAAVATLMRALDAPSPPPFLLHGITGSGKTQVYIELLREVVERRGKTAVVLVPEIALTPQTVTRFRSWFGDRVAVLHSGLSDGERYDAWRQLRSGDKRIVVGARSALFAPLPDLGAIVVDEEHDGSYKQSEAPRYHGRDMALLRAKFTGAVAVLGSATPALESWQNVASGKLRLLSLPDRAGGGQLPPVEVVDLRALKDSGSGAGGEGGGFPVLSPRLHEAIGSTLERGEQVILLMNRRGYSAFIQCRGCGEVQQCPHCSISLTFHRARRQLVCHHCRHETAAPSRCPGCGDTELSWRGLGTEQVERVVAEAFPTARLARMDVDTTGGKWAHAEILGRVGRGEVDILLGTQMIAKGLDFPQVTLVGVIHADVGLHLPDFRASERTFQLLSQVAGRAGRGPRGGRVILQTAMPDHYAILKTITHDYVGFAARELDERRNPPYPPHRRLVNVVVSSPAPEQAAKGAEWAAKWWRTKGEAHLEVVGPAPAPIERLSNRWRWHLFLRGGSVSWVSRALRQFLADSADVQGGGDVRFIVDRDPVALL